MEKIEEFRDNKSLTVVPLLVINQSLIDCKWVLEKKRKTQATNDMNMGWLLAIELQHKKKTDFEETFALVA